jgi:hypothetical protein
MVLLALLQIMVVIAALAVGQELIAEAVAEQQVMLDPEEQALMVA